MLGEFPAYLNDGCFTIPGEAKWNWEKAPTRTATNSKRRRWRRKILISYSVFEQVRQRCWERAGTYYLSSFRYLLVPALFGINRSVFWIPVFPNISNSILKMVSFFVDLNLRRLQYGTIFHCILCVFFLCPPWDTITLHIALNFHHPQTFLLRSQYTSRYHARSPNAE